jgi:predicted CXXCH cytochrome family protein
MTTDSGAAVVATKTEGGLTDTATTTYVTPENTLAPFTNNAIFYEGRTVTWYLWFDTASGIWLKCDGLNGTGSCAAPLTSADYLTTVDMEGQTVYLYGYKLLTRYPNGTDFPESWGLGRGGHDGARWCGTCHPAQAGEEIGGEFHSHPGSCTYCHGNPADGSSFDFPHTSTNGSLLKEYPDALCVVCHSKGSLN